MGLFKRKKEKKKIESVFADIESDIRAEEPDDTKRAGHIAIDHCEQIIELAKGLEDTRAEYKMVTAYLNDIELIASLEEEDKAEITEAASNVVQLTKAREEYLHTTKKITDAQYIQMEQEENHITEAVRRLKSNEVYLDTLQRDMNYLEGEKLQWDYNGIELRDEQKKLGALAMVLLSCAVINAVVCVVIAYCYEVDTVTVWSLINLVLALCGAFVELRIQKNKSEIRQSDANLNRSIELLNKVKIRYVNTKNAVDYVCEKYHVRTARDLEYIWEQYLEAVREREKYMQTNEDLEYFNARLVKSLKRYRLYDPRVWVTQAQALIDSREMVEIKHNLVQRRQKLRSRIEFSMEQITGERQEIEKLLESNPEGKEEIEEIVHSIDKLCGVNM